MATAGLRLGIPKKVVVLSLDTPGWLWNFDGFVKSPSAALRFTFVVAAHLKVRFTSQILRALHLELFTKPSFMNLLFSSFKISAPGYKEVSGKRALSLGEWILPAFGIPSRNPAVANNPREQKS
jgi:hypothetical protein